MKEIKVSKLSKIRSDIVRLKELQKKEEHKACLAIGNLVITYLNEGKEFDSSFRQRVQEIYGMEDKKHKEN